MKTRSLLLALCTLSVTVIGAFAQRQLPVLADGFRTGRLKIQPQTVFAAKSSVVPSECKQEEIAFAKIASRLPLPEKWTFYVVCDEPSWSNYVQRITIEKHLGMSTEVYGATYQQGGYTVLRGYKLTHPDELTTPERIVAHELAHIYLHSSNEEQVDKLARTWVKDLGDTRVTDSAVATLVSTK
jgi:hypothetical protein